MLTPSLVLLSSYSDGTTNFVHSFPFSCVSIGLCVAGEPVLGVVYCASTRELFLAAKGAGAFLNGRRISVSAAKSLPEALVLTEFGYSREAKNVDKWLSTARTVVLAGAHGLRSLGSGVIDLCYIAAGRVDAGYTGVSEEGWKPWDYCAGAVILTEAGATLTNIRGDRFDLYGDSILTAATPELAKEPPPRPSTPTKQVYLYKYQRTLYIIKHQHDKRF